jgi:hypothetical protein
MDLEGVGGRDGSRRMMRGGGDRRL